MTSEQVFCKDPLVVCLTTRLLGASLCSLIARWFKHAMLLLQKNAKLLLLLLDYGPRAYLAWQYFCS